jgi:superfamily II DNA or RNA helicase
MPEYPDPSDDNFYTFINKKYAKYKIPKKQKTLKQICFPQSYQFQIPQKFLGDFINPKTPYKGVLVYHRIGAGKTCTAINVAEHFKGYKRIMIVLPASLKGNFRSELRSLCAGQNYLTDKERLELKKYHPSDSAYKDIIKRSDEKIDKYYIIYSYNKFVDLIKERKLNLKNTLLIIDEVHNMISETGTYYETLYDVIKKAPGDLRLLLMSATPIFDKPIEIALTMNLLLPKKHELPTGNAFINTFIKMKMTPKGPIYSTKNLDKFKELVRGYVSYYRGAPPHVFPRTELHIVKCKMSNKQLKLYNKVVKKEFTDPGDYVNEDISNSFFIGTRMVSNFMYPNKQIGLEGFDSLTDGDFTKEKLAIYSPKFLKILRRIKRCQGTVFVYSNFKEFGGIRPFVRMLEHYGYHNYRFDGPGRKRFAIWSGDEDPMYKEEIKAVFNGKDNENGSQIKIIVTSPAAKEGVSFLRIQEVHIIDTYWNWSRLDQIIGRSVRFCSHKDVEYEKQLVKVYIYLAVHPTLKISIDQHIMQIAINKKQINGDFERCLKETAIDCELFKNANVYKGEEDIICEI